MKTVKTNIFRFDELSQKAKEKAINEVREQYYEHNNFSQWAIDDDYILEPSQKELKELFGKDYEPYFIKNKRNIYFSLDRNRYIDISKAVEITDEDMFLKWLGADLGEDKVYFTIGKDTIDFEENSWEYEFTEEENEILEKAKHKFEEYCNEVLNRIEKDIDYRFSDESIKEDIEDNDFYFLESGEIY